MLQFLGQTGSFVFVIIGLLFGGGYYLVNKEVLVEIEKATKSVKKQVEQTEKVAKNLDKDLQKVKKYESAFGERQQLADYREYLPETFTSTELINTLSREAQEAQAYILSSRPVSVPQPDQSKEEDAEKIFYKITGAEIKIQVDYKTLLIFLSRMTTVKKLILLRNFSLTYEKGKDLPLVFLGTFHAYYSSSLHEDSLKTGETKGGKK